MTSTHTGNPVCAAAVLANLQVICDEHLVENGAARMGEILQPALRRIGQQVPQGSRWGPCTARASWLRCT